MSYWDFGDSFCIVKINGKQHYLWCVVDQDGVGGEFVVNARHIGLPGNSLFGNLLISRVAEQKRSRTVSSQYREDISQYIS